MVAAHNLVTADGVQPDTDEYFETVERILGVQAPAASVAAAEAPMSAASAPTQRRSSPAAAPVSRSGTGTGGGSPNVVRLSADEREMAKMMGMTAEEYARNKLALIKDGKLTKH
jgi:phage I-like protein